MVGFNRRFDPSFKALRDRLQAGEIGKPEQVIIFVDCVEKGAKPLAGFAGGREALRLADAALESLRKGDAVRLA